MFKFKGKFGFIEGFPSLVEANVFFSRASNSYPAPRPSLNVELGGLSIAIRPNL